MLKVGSLTCALTACLIMVASGSYAAEKSNRGPKLATFVAEAMQSLPAELREGAKVVDVGAHASKTYRPNSRLLTRRSTDNIRHEGCVALVAFSPLSSALGSVG